MIRTGIKFCPYCGRQAKVKKRESYDTQTGKLRGYNLDISCSARVWRCIGASFVWWGYQDV